MTRPSDPAMRGSGASGNPLARQFADEARRVALALMAPGTSRVERQWAIAWIHERPAMEVAQGLVTDQLDQLFLDAASANGLVAGLPARLVEVLAARKLQVVANVIRQEHVLGEACGVLDEFGVEHVVFKGALLRTLVYTKPHLRPAVDVDILVEPGSVPRVVRLFEQRGYGVSVAAHSDTHELSVTRQGVLIDVHRSLLRPGRMRTDITREIVEARVRRGSLWGPGDAHLTVAMLVHPAITDHVTGRLSSAMDLDLWIRGAAVPWAQAIALLRRIGLRTAAWAMLAWTQALFATPVPETVWRELAPGPLRRPYLEAWLRHHPARLYNRHPLLVRGTFSLALQDRMGDAARALWMLARKDRVALDQV